jgi:hypothetical protein
MMAFFSLFLILSSLVQAESCKNYYAVSKGNSFRIQFGGLDNPEAIRTCEVKDNEVNHLPLKIMGCVPFEAGNPNYFLVKSPKGWTHPCFERAPTNFLVYANDFQMKKIPSDEEPVGCLNKLDPPKEFLFTGRSDPLGLLLSDLAAEENKLKKVTDVEKYHNCLLGKKWEKGQKEDYQDVYRYMLEDASLAFGVPHSLLSCLCGRESRFLSKAVSFSGVKGLCQTTEDLLTDVRKWKEVIPEVKKDWNKYIQALGKKIEHPECAKMQLSSKALKKCPSLGFGVASIYLKYAYAKIEENEKFGDVYWETQSLQTLVSLAAAYNVGVELSDRALAKSKKNSWGTNLLKATCKRFGPKKFREAKSHMMALRSCLQSDNWLDHHGKPLGGECAISKKEEAALKDRLASYESSLPKDCED